MKPCDYYRPTSLDEARRLKRELPGARYLAGGTDLLVKIKHGSLAPPALISLRGIAQLDGITAGEPLRIGALTRLSDVLEHPLVRERYPVLVQAIARMASVQIRNAASFGGNLCNASPCADTAPPLLVLGARFRIAGSGGERVVPIEEFHTGPGTTRLCEDEVLTDILLDPPAPAARAMFLKKTRVAVDMSLASVAVLVEMDGDLCRRARIAAGAVAPVPLRLRAVERMLEGERITPERLARARELAAQSVAPISDVRTSESYRRHIVGVYVQRGVESLLGWRSA